MHRDRQVVDEASELDHLLCPAGQRDGADVDHAVVTAGQHGLRSRRAVGHDRVLLGEAVAIAVLGEQKVHGPLGPVLDGADGGRGHAAQRTRQPGLEGDGSGGVLVDVPHRDGVAGTGERAEQLRIVHEDDVVGGCFTPHEASGRADRRDASTAT